MERVTFLFVIRLLELKLGVLIRLKTITGEHTDS